MNATGMWWTFIAFERRASRFVAHVERRIRPVLEFLGVRDLGTVSSLDLDGYRTRRSLQRVPRTMADSEVAAFVFVLRWALFVGLFAGNIDRRGRGMAMLLCAVARVPLMSTELARTVMT